MRMRGPIYWGSEPHAQQRRRHPVER
ncbi:hypothetical protein SEA_VIACONLECTUS_18 [Gordonia phage ViaConlectus]|uniref:Uncharacterized protein n=1 Tax=Gordonia phage ViaConlectus TaxID=2972515 RepID=A0A976UE28_9CAUD|nr:hypothetical protein SEA_VIACONLECTUS_18 [Gordonia phage ViaConlectus]